MKLFRNNVEVNERSFSGLVMTNQIRGIERRAKRLAEQDSCRDADLGLVEGNQCGESVVVIPARPVNQSGKFALDVAHARSCHQWDSGRPPRPESLPGESSV
jgi:hypothetical protein